MTEPCAHCQGTGKISSAETVSLIAERDLRRVARTEKKPSEALQITVHPDVAEYLVGPDGENIDRIEREIQRAIFVRASVTQIQEQVDIESGTMVEFEGKFASPKRNAIVDCRVERSLLRPEPAVVGWVEGLLLELPDNKRQVGQKVRAKITQSHRSYACAAPVTGSGRGVDKTD